MALVAFIEGVVRRTLTDPSSGKERDYYFGSVESDRIRALTFVPVLEESPRTYLNERTEAGYQRYASPTRMNLFADYLRNNPLSVVPPVVLSGRGRWEFEGDSVGRLIVQDAAAIIDGQHRVGGYVRLYEQSGQVRPVDFILLPSLSLEEEKQEFVTINNTQVGVTKALTAYLQASDDAQVAWELNLRDDSPFCGKITRQKMQRQHLFALHSVAKNVGRTFSHGALVDLSVDAKVDMMIRYWTMIADYHPTEWADIEKSSRGEFEFKLLELTGFIAWSWAAEDILGPAFDPERQAMNWDLVEAKIRRLGESRCVDWAKDGKFQGLTGEVGGKKIHSEIQWCLQAASSE